MATGVLQPQCALMNESSELQWVLQARNGDATAFRSLVQRYANRLLSVAYGVTGEFESARDVVQDVFVSAYRNLKNLQKPEAFEAWLVSMARNRAASWLRKTGRERKALRRYGDQQKKQDEQDPFNRPGEHSDLLHDALQTLTEEEREILALRHMAECSLQDMASQLQLSYEGVKSRLSRARQHLWDALQRARKRDSHTG